MSDPWSTPSATPQVVFDHERLEVYQDAVRFLVTADTLVQQLPPGRAYLADQLRRAALSIVLNRTGRSIRSPVRSKSTGRGPSALNVAEGAGEFSPSEKARFYRMALRSATECAAITDASTALRVAEDATAALARQQLFAIVRMLSRMVLNLTAHTPRKPRRPQTE